MSSLSPLLKKEQYTMSEPDYLFETLKTDSIVVFWKPPGFMSNWTHSPFTYDGHQYNCAEQAIMHQKALLFKDPKMGAAIMNTDSPKKQKSLGRKVVNFDEKVWQQNVPDLAYGILRAKFTDNPNFRELLLQTGEREIFEASPYDKIWGIGSKPEVAVKYDSTRLNAKGSNLLGKTLMRVRKDLR